MFTKKWARDAAERAVSTFAQTAVASLAVSAGLRDVNWLAVGSVAGLAALLSVLKSVAATRVNDSQSASLVNLEKKS